MKTIATILLALLLPQIALARDPYRLPAGKRFDDPPRILYTLEEFKVILKMDVDLEFYEKTQLPKIKAEVELLRKSLEAQTEVIKSKDTQLSIANQDRTRLTEKWSQENKARLECENKPKFGSWIAWTIAAVMAASALSLGIVLIVKESK